MGTTPVRFTSATALLLLAACSADQPLTAPSLARGSGGAQLTATPTAVEFSVPPGGSEVVTVSVQYVTTVSSTTSNSSCATVSPTSAPTKKTQRSPLYIATFTITAVGAGNCTVTLTDKNGKSTTVAVTVGAPLPDRIVYNSSGDVWIMDLDGQNKAPLTTTTDQTEWGVISPDGRKVLMFWNKQVDGVWLGGYQTMGVDGSNPTALGISGDISFADFSPNSRQLVFTRRFDFRERLFKADLSGANEVQLTSPGDLKSDKAPSWAGGTPGRIAFIREGERSLWIMNADGSGQTLVLDNSENWLHDTFSLSLSPDGTLIAFECTLTIHVQDVCVVNVDGTGKTQLTTAAGNDSRPRWTRDGRIIFTSRRDGNEEVYIMNADGTGQVNLTNTTDVNESTDLP